MKTIRTLPYFLLCILLFWAPSLHALIDTYMLNKTGIEPGDQFKEKITLKNDQDKTIDVELKQVDYSFNNEGENHYLPEGTLPFSNANWVNLSSKWIRIGPHSKVDVTYTITVPENPELEGSYSSLILLEPQQPLEPLGKKKKDKPQIIVKIRYAYLIVTTVGNPKSDVKVLNKGVAELNNKKMLMIDLENKGKRFCQPKVHLNLFNHEGRLIMDTITPPQKLLPSTSVRYFVDINKFVEDANKGIMYISDDKNCFLAEQVDFSSEDK